MKTALVWFRQDLRLADNPAWKRAVESGYAVIPVYLHCPEEAGQWAPGGAGRWWLHHALKDMQDQLDGVGARLILRRGRGSLSCLEKLLGETGAEAVFWNRCYEPFRIRTDGKIKEKLRGSDVEAWSGNSALLREPWKVSTREGNPYRVFTPYAKACAQFDDPSPVNAEATPRGPKEWPGSENLEQLGLLPDKDWDSGFGKFWEPTRKGGLEQLDGFLSEAVREYDVQRDYPARDSTSRMSPYLHWGQIGPREIAAALRRGKTTRGLEVFYNEIIWREFAYHVLYHFPDTPTKPLQLKFEAFPWREAINDLKAWQTGRTGYPLVDAGMRQLWRVGWMHNRVRMVVGSFLVKHLLHSWEHGAEWFWDTLVDADLASNTLGWQWAGGCGADAAPYFRVFNPITQSEKFDADGQYIRRYLPELENVPDKYIHAPWKMPPEVQEEAGCRIGEDYPFPVIGHKEGRERALQTFEQIKKDK